MTRLLPLLFLFGLVAEIASIIWMGRAVGVAGTLLLLFLGGIVGMSLIKSAGTGIAAALRSPVQASSLQQGAAGVAVARVAAGLLFIIPGFFSDALGLLLLLPPVRQWLRSKVAVQGFSASSMGPEPRPRRYDTVIDAEAIEIVAEVEPPARPGSDGRMDSR
jgi:UPF0716 protein FxsA